jgi:crossover junction endodeoxyribonuclease RuvC
MTNILPISNHTKKYYLGIDPGYNGALAFYCPEDDDLIVYDMPISTSRTRKLEAGRIKVKRDIDLVHLALLVQAKAAQTVGAVVEDVHAMPAQGVVSTFNFGFNAGAAQMAVAAAMIPCRLPRPQLWKAMFGLIRVTKEVSRAKASQLCPKHSHHWRLVKHDGRAEAVLLAIYASKQDW